MLRNPASTRPWQHVLDCLSGYFAYLSALAIRPQLPRALNFGPRHRRATTAGELAATTLRALGAESSWSHTPVPDSHEACALALDSRLARQTLGWRDRMPVNQMVAATASWYRAWAEREDMRSFTLAQFAEYEALP
jgi:CDP-glucose 4,6-dehydratase